MVHEDRRNVLARIADERRKKDLQAFIDFLNEQGTIVRAHHDEVEAEGHDMNRFFRPENGLTQEDFVALVAIDPYASGMLARAVVQRLVIDRGFDALEVYRAVNELGYSIWDQVPDEISFEFAAKELEVKIYERRAKRNEERDHHDESKINPHGDWSVIVVRQGTFNLTPLARRVFPVIYRAYLNKVDVNANCLRQETGLDHDRFDQCLRRSGIWGTVVGPVPGRKGFWRIIP